MSDVDDRYKPGSHGCHEALHMASVLADMVDTHLVEHPAVVAVPEWAEKARAALDALADLYQAIGSEHMQCKDEQ